MGRCARLNVTRRLWPDKTLLEAKNGIPEGWGLFFSPGDAAQWRGRPVLQVTVAEAVARATQRRAALAPRCDPELLAAFDGLIGLVADHRSGMLRLDPDELREDVTIDELVDLANAFGPNAVDGLATRLGELLGQGAMGVFGASPNGKLEWLRPPVPAIPGPLAACASGFFAALRLPLPEATFSDSARGWRWECAIGGPPSPWLALNGASADAVTLTAIPARERSATTPAAGWVLAKGADADRIAWWGQRLAEHRDVFARPSASLRAWHENEAAEPLIAQWRPTARERAHLEFALRTRLVAALFQLPERGAHLRVGLGKTSVDLHRIPASPSVPEHLVVRMVAGAGDEAWWAATAEELTPPVVVRAEARKFLEAALAVGLTLTLGPGPTVTLFADRLVQPMTFIYAIHNRPELRAYAVSLMDLPDDAARAAALARDG